MILDDLSLPFAPFLVVEYHCWVRCQALLRPNIRIAQYRFDRQDRSWVSNRRLLDRLRFNFIYGDGSLFILASSASGMYANLRTH